MCFCVNMAWVAGYMGLVKEGHNFKKIGKSWSIQNILPK